MQLSLRWHATGHGPLQLRRQLRPQVQHDDSVDRAAHALTMIHVTTREGSIARWFLEQFQWAVNLAGRGLRGLVVASIAALLLTNVALADQWARSYGGTDAFGSALVRQTADGGFVVVGSQQTSDSVASIWVMKLD